MLHSELYHRVPMDPAQTQKYYQQLASSMMEQQIGKNQAQAFFAGQGPSTYAPATAQNSIGLPPHKKKPAHRPQHMKQPKQVNAGLQQQPLVEAQKEYDEGLVSLHLIFSLVLCRIDHNT